MTNGEASRNAGVQDSGSKDAGVHDGGPEPTVKSRLHFLWFAFIAVLWTIPMAMLQLLSLQFSPTARNFKRNAGIWGGGHPGA